MTQAMHRILVVEDDESIRSVLRVLLQAAQYRVVEAATAERAGIEARTHKPDVMLVDLGLPDRDGLQVIRGVRAWSPMPIIVLSARSMEEQKVAALDAGADDFVTKPFSAGELLARLRAALRRTVRGPDQSFLLRLGAVEIDFARRESRKGDAALHLTPLEYRVLESLARHSGMIVRQQQLIREVWGPGHAEDTRSLRVCVKNLRSKLEPDPQRPRYLITETGLGYRLRMEEAEAQAP
jgi:two-component system KDP operon response regulator KdpE